MILAAVVASASGCGKKMWVMEYPDFYGPQLKTVAVVPFDSPPHPTAGRMLADRLADALRENGTYRVVRPAALPEAPLSTTRPADEEEALDRLLDHLRERGDVQAVIVGTIDLFRISRRDYYYPVRRSAYWGHGYRGYRGFGYGNGQPYYCDYEHYVRSEATVAADAAIIRVMDGQVMHVAPAMLATTVSEDSYASRGVAVTLLDEAAEHVIERMVDEFAVVRKRIGINPDHALRTARGEGERDWLYEDDFTDTDTKALVIVRLPRQADRNPLRITVRREGRDAILAEESFTWRSGQGAWVMEFSPAALVDAGGIGEYKVRLYSQGEEALKRQFKIRRSRLR